MKYAPFILAIFLLSIVVIGGALLMWSNRRRKPRGFRDWVKDPEYRQEMEDYLNELDSVEVPDDISEAEIRKMVDQLFVQKDDPFNVERLKKCGAKAAPLLMEALNNPKTYTMTFAGADAVDAKSPFERICELLEPIAPAEAAQPLSKFIAHEDDDFRKQAALVLGAIGSAECIDPMIKALSDEDDYVRSYAMMGIDRGLDANRCSRDFLNAMFPPLKTLLNRDDSSVSDDAPRLLLAIDAQRALAAMLAPEYFTVDNHKLQYILKALNEAGHKIPHENLLPLLGILEPLAQKYPHDYAYAEALEAYARNPDSSAEKTFRAALTSSNGNIQSAAAKGLAITVGVAGGGDLAYEKLRNDGMESLSVPQQHYVTVNAFDYHVTNGGFEQYFGSTNGDDWRMAIEGLKAVGAGERAKILEEAVAEFGERGPAADELKRSSQMQKFSKKQKDNLEAFASKYYKLKENVEMLLIMYTITHKEYFVKPK